MKNINKLHENDKNLKRALLKILLDLNIDIPDKKAILNKNINEDKKTSNLKIIKLIDKTVKKHEI